MTFNAPPDNVIEVVRLDCDGKTIYVLGEKMAEDQRLYLKIWSYLVHMAAKADAQDSIALHEINKNTILFGLKQDNFVATSQKVWDFLMNEIGEKKYVN